jgi:hypothetical protein
MRYRLFVLAAGLMAAPALAGTAGTSTAAFPKASWFVCDDIAGPLAAAFGPRDAGGASQVMLIDRRSGRVSKGAVQVGDADPGAGQVYYPLSRAGKPVGNIHMVNPGMVGNPPLPAVTGLDLDGHHFECRFMPDMRLLGIARTRSVMVRGLGAGLVYESFDYRTLGAATHPDGVHRSNAPSLTISDGQAGAGGYRFTNAGVDYRVVPGGVAATQGAQTIASDVFLASEAAPIRTVTVAGPASVWPAGASFTGCRGDLSNAALHDCLIAAMKAGGATPAALAFTERLAADRDIGFMTGWRQAGPVGVATVVYPWRANANESEVIVPPAGDLIYVDAYQPSAADKTRPDWRGFVAAHPQAFPVTPATVSAAKTAPGAPVTIHARYRLATCRACAALGDMTVAWRFGPDGRLVGAGVERVTS